jgi:hypothetical protein
MQFLRATHRLTRWLWVFPTLLFVSELRQTAVHAQFDFEKPPINYNQGDAHDPVADLSRAVEAGTLELAYDEEHGWLPAILKHLQISVESQLLVFSKTSLQLHKIDPRHPRAIYFNDNVYVGWVQNGAIELAATDPQKGAIFYTVEQTVGEPLRFIADRGQCLTCHATHRTQNVPGYLVRSIFSDFNGRPRSGTRTYITDHTTEFEKRYGGWYVSGTHGQMRHMGNVLAPGRGDPEQIDRELGANRSELSGLVDAEPYLTAHSDLVALLILEHQSQMHNLIARANFETRTALYYDQSINEALERPIDTASESSERRIKTAAEALIRYMLFADEHELTHPVAGSSLFAEQFQANDHPLAHVDSQGRSLRQFDLNKRIFKYPCSYLIYSEAFDGLPDRMLLQIKTRLTEILTSPSQVVGYERLSESDRRNISEILEATKPGFLLAPTDQSDGSH